MGDAQEKDIFSSPSWLGSTSAGGFSPSNELLIFSYAPKNRILLSCTGDVEQVLGCKLKELSRNANLFLKFVHPEDRFAVLNAFEASLRGADSYRVTYRWIRPDNDTQIWLHCRGELREIEGQEIFQGFLIDISEDLNHFPLDSHGFFSLANVLQSIPYCLTVLDERLRITFLNHDPNESSFFDANSTFHKAEVRIGGQFSDCVRSPGEREELSVALQSIIDGQEDHFTYELVSKDRHYLLSAHPILAEENICGVLLHIQDTSSNQQAQKELSELRKAEGFRRIASSLAHHLNNNLQAILGHATSIRIQSENPKRIRMSAGLIHELAETASGLSQQLLALDTNSRLHGSFDINVAVMEALNHFDDLFTSTKHIAVSFVNLPPVVGNVTKIMASLEQILSTIHEYHEPGSNIQIHTAEQVSDPEKNSDRVKLSFQFTPSFPESAREELTTRLTPLKHELKTIYATLEVRPAQNGEILFEVTLPSAVNNARHEMKQALSKKRNLKLNTPLILVVDDDSIVLQTVQLMLSGSGYQCLTASQFSEAMKHIKQYGDQIQLVLLDALMPGMDGASMLKRLQKVISAPVVGFSGAPPGVTQSLIDAGAVELLRKPLTHQALVQCVSRYLPEPEKSARAERADRHGSGS